MDTKEKWVSFIEQLQIDICTALENADGKATFIEDKWTREEGGGGNTRVISNGAVFEKGGVNTSVVFGTVTPAMRTQLNINADQWFACGLSLVLHPGNPMLPTVHCNYRMFELYDKNGLKIDRWFGGGTDLTPYYLFEDDAIHFHQVHRDACDKFDVSLYPDFKQQCDAYFVNTHRNNERRGIGGIFYDHQKPSEKRPLEFWMGLAHECGYGFLKAYLPIIERRKGNSFTAAEKYWQEIRRGRYVEFNLLHDRGTIFGIKTNGRTESILMSLPATVRFDYDYKPAHGSREEELLQVCLQPKDWLALAASDKIEWSKSVNSC